MHNGMLTMGDGPKMGKSQGNAFNIHDLLKIFPAEAIRLYYLQTHYRSPLPWLGQESLQESLAMLGRLYEARHVARQMKGEEQADAVADALGADAQTVLSLGRDFRASFLDSITDDFNTSKGLGLAFELARAINRLSNHKKAKKRGGPVVAPALSALEIVGETLGLLTLTYGEFHDEVKAKRLPALGLTSEAVQARLDERRIARNEKQWGRADEIRADLEAKGILVMDHADGSDWRLKL
jgi:cysteinyl-tRNA synthetase